MSEIDLPTAALNPLDLHDISNVLAEKERMVQTSVAEYIPIHQLTIGRELRGLNAF
jgi:hypothetical protein